MNAFELANSLIKRIKLLRKFEITTEVPERFRFNGKIPFDIEIKDNLIKAEVYAVTHEEAYETFNDFLKGCK